MHARKEFNQILRVGRAACGWAHWVVACAVMTLQPDVLAADPSGLQVASLMLQDTGVGLVPDVLLRRPGDKSAQRQSLSTGQALAPGTEITLPRGATVVLASRNDNRITVYPGADFVVGVVTDRGESHQPVSGKTSFDVRQALDFFNVTYSRFTAAVKGTKYAVDISLSGQTVEFLVTEGKVEVEQRVPVRLRNGVGAGADAGADADSDGTTPTAEIDVRLVDNIAAGEQRRYDLDVERYLKEFGNFAEAESYFLQALAEAERSGIAQRQHRALANLMEAYRALGRPQAGLALAPRCDDAAKAVGLPVAMQVCDTAAGNLLNKMGRPREALPRHQRVLDVERTRLQGRDSTWAATALNNLSNSYRDVAQIDRAVQMQLESLLSKYE